MDFQLFYNDHRKRSWGRWHINTSRDDWFESKREAQKQIDDIQSGLRLEELVKREITKLSKELNKYAEDEAKYQSEIIRTSHRILNFQSLLERSKFA